ncbi:hypothetical protein A9995_11120 [Erythrobacter sp. QSSC1-22B]|uniref:Rossmann fold domain-containing protein n=1 Tax=Erythrobacter sp. QSSC1-22B TaxID=1860125 RepID=UPI00080514D6|nr:hypothetical protein [Erythrobacter sp. QSSC1-22B]OBX18514.1 hypothetical protein A9995_11120 [Erythrobacter sp. QSSC1-22B]
MKRIAVDDLPPEPLAAAGLFHQHWLPHVEGALESGEDVMVTLAAADHSHREWRLAIAAGLARAHTPQRINLVAGEGAALDGFEAWLANAPGITGQYFESDGTGAGDPFVEAP